MFKGAIGSERPLPGSPRTLFCGLQEVVRAGELPAQMLS